MAQGSGAIRGLCFLWYNLETYLTPRDSRTSPFLVLMFRTVVVPIAARGIVGDFVFGMPNSNATGAMVVIVASRAHVLAAIFTRFIGHYLIRLIVKIDAPRKALKA